MKYYISMNTFVTTKTYYYQNTKLFVILILMGWTIRTPAVDNMWSKVTFGNDLFVAVAYTGTCNRVMTSPDGTTWTIGTSAADD